MEDKGAVRLWKWKWDVRSSWMHRGNRVESPSRNELRVDLFFSVDTTSFPYRHLGRGGGVPYVFIYFQSRRRKTSNFSWNSEGIPGNICLCVFRLLPDRHVLAFHWFYLRADKDDRALPLTFDLSLSLCIDRGGHTFRCSLSRQRSRWQRRRVRELLEPPPAHKPAVLSPSGKKNRIRQNLHEAASIFHPEDV